MPKHQPRSLAVILATPPLTTSGQRTLSRVRLASDVIGASRVSICNLLDVATKDIREIAVVGTEPGPWLASRQAILAALLDTDFVLLAWGGEPTGPARHHHRAQVAWIMRLIATQETAAWAVGAQPRHPSRWQRYTSRAHPGISFNSALERSLRKLAPDSRFDQPGA